MANPFDDLSKRELFAAFALWCRLYQRTSRPRTAASVRSGQLML